MVRRRVAVVLAVALLAGCQGGAVDPSPVTPAPVPTASGPVTVDAERIATAHRTALAGTSYTTTVRWRVSYPNGSVGLLTDRFTVGADGSYRYERRLRGHYPGARENVTTWHNGSADFVRRPAENGTRTVRVRTGRDFDTSLSGFVDNLLNRFTLTGERTARGTRLSGRQESLRPVPLPGGLRNGRNATVDAEIRDDVVRAVTVRARADDRTSGQSVDVRISLSVERVGQSQPTRPPWAAAPAEPEAA